MRIETDRRLVLRYSPGQFTFRNMMHTTSDENMMRLARAINSLQEENATKILRVQTFQF